MTVELKPLSNSAKHPQLERWYYSSNPISHQLGYGRYARRIIKALLAVDSPFVRQEYLHGIFNADRLVGFVLIYPVKDALHLHQISHDYLKANISRLFYLRRKSFYRKVARALGNHLPDKGAYIHSIVIDQSYRNKGIGTAVLEKIAKKHKELALYVNDKNHAAVHFYLKNGFKISHHGQFRYKNEYYGEYLMIKNESKITTQL